jgi:tRNA(fMet)-specific endonuclease VapC
LNYLLDTNTCIYALKQNERVIDRLLAAAREDVVVSVITEAALRTGAAKSSTPSKTLQLGENFLSPITLIVFTSDDAITYATVRAKLERAGRPIGPLDTLIAAQALARKLTLVSNSASPARFGTERGKLVALSAGKVVLFRRQF